MNSKLIIALIVSPAFVSCGEKTKHDNAVMSTKGSAAPARFAVVKSCKGLMNEKWLSPDNKAPVLGELDISVLAKPGTKQIQAVALRQLIPAHRIEGSSEIIPSALSESKSAAIEAIHVSMSRGSTVTLMKAAPNQTLALTTDGRTELNKLVSLEFRNGDGADFVTLKLTLLNSGTAQTSTGTVSFEGCILENLSLLKANSR